MSRPTNSAFCAPGNHFVPRGTTSSFRVGDFAFLACPEHQPDEELLSAGEREVATTTPAPEKGCVGARP